jgi:hypothetical protein
MSGNNIKVVCRFRPQNKLEIKEGGLPIIDVHEDGTAVTLKVSDKNLNAIDMHASLILLDTFVYEPTLGNQPTSFRF